MNSTEWDPAEFFSGDLTPAKFALVILNCELQLPISVYRKLWSNAAYKVAADGGANRLHTLNVNNDPISLDLDAIVGDLDSLQTDTREYWSTKGVTISYDSDQDTTDFVKSVHHLRCSQTQRSNNIVVLGGLSGRVDQAMSVLHQIYALQKEPAYRSGRVYLLSSEAITFILQPGKHSIRAKKSFPNIALGRNVGIIPLKDATVISTEGLEWDVHNWETEIGGRISTSNHVREEIITIQTSKDVLFTIDLDTSD
ncbi:BgTH12-00180 [Blumeria graminis f. sp. triticale]|uniref:Thiamine pyrophosphokinase n=3 Tax=Blumeria graminis TaxID=34373 RepID=A0A061HQB5_BLUGR|nr:Thiamine pyrophosphokinase [Blumeria graminis f. sp. tritici 96224]CAD6504674.1 BgTH12-00180 [Blumeria graminis f. sp. triticale]VDB92713.1 Bgt-5500 [Blumeria graminis f. sp. tritici]